MKNTLLLLIAILCYSCKQDIEIVKGDLYFKLVNLTPPQGMTKEQATKIEKMLDSAKSNAHLNNGEKAIVDYFQKLKDEKLLRSPYIKLRFNKTDIKTIFLKPEEYKKIKIYTLGYLRENKMKIEVELKMQQIDSFVYYSDEIIKVNQVKGETYFEK